jgi:hypothetical protein
MDAMDTMDKTAGAKGTDWRADYAARYKALRAATRGVHFLKAHQVGEGAPYVTVTLTFALWLQLRSPIQGAYLSACASRGLTRAARELKEPWAASGWGLSMDQQAKDDLMAVYQAGRLAHPEGVSQHDLTPDKLRELGEVKEREAYEEYLKHNAKK